MPAATSTFSIARRTSPRASSMIFPWSWLTIRASSSKCCSMRSRNVKKYRARLRGGVSRHSSHASSPARTAASTSARGDRGTRAMTSPVAGFVSSSHSDADDSTHAPPMKFLRSP